VDLWGKKKDGKPKLSPEQREVAAVDAWIAAMPEEKQKALGMMISGLMPALVSQMRLHAALPFAELGEVLKKHGGNLIYRLTSPGKCIEAIGQALLTHAPTIQRICREAAEDFLRRERMIKQLEAKQGDVIDIEEAAPLLLEPLT